jgi:hypothetical protein
VTITNEDIQRVLEEKDIVAQEKEIAIASVATIEAKRQKAESEIQQDMNLINEFKQTKTFQRTVFGRVIRHLTNITFLARKLRGVPNLVANLV